jgi:hypothetical protein
VQIATYSDRSMFCTTSHAPHTHTLRYLHSHRYLQKSGGDSFLANVAKLFKDLQGGLSTRRKHKEEEEVTQLESPHCLLGRRLNNNNNNRS